MDTDISGGAELLEQADPRFKVYIWLNSSPPVNQENVLRLGKIGLSRESIWTNQLSIENFKRNLIGAQQKTGNPFDFIWFGWSYQAT